MVSSAVIVLVIVVRFSIPFIRLRVCATELSRRCENDGTVFNIANNRLVQSTRKVEQQEKVVDCNVVHFYCYPIYIQVSTPL